MTHYPWVLRLAQRFVLRTARSPLRRLWLLGYGLIGVTTALYLTRGQGKRHRVRQSQRSLG